MTTEAATAEIVHVGAVRSALRDTGAAIREVFAHRALRRLQLALTGSMIGDWAYFAAVMVWAYDVGGARAVGIWCSIRLLVMAVTAPFASSLADTKSRKLVLVASDLTRCGLVTAAAICISVGTPAAPVFILATLVGLVSAVFRPALSAWTPALVDRPEQLTSSNGVASTIESLAMFVGPAVGSAIIAATNVQTVFFFDAATFIWSAGLIVSISARPVPVDEDPDERDEEGRLATMLAGFREIAHSRDLCLIGVLLAAQTIIAGASSVFLIILAVDTLDAGAAGFGYFNAVLGAGAVVGGFIAIGRAARHKLAFDLSIGVMLWSLPLLLIVAWQSPVTAFAACALLGCANPLVDVNYATATQRVTPNRVLGRVFGAFEGIAIATMALGAAVMPFLVEAFGLRSSLAIIGLAVGVSALLLVPAAIRLDRRLEAPVGLAVLQLVPIFAPLGPARIDALAHQLGRIDVPPGTEVIAEGESGDLFYVIESGRVSVTHQGRQVREMTAGQYFGEIALLRDSPRTATVTAVERTVLLTLARAPFLEAVRGNAESSSTVEAVVSSRIRF